MNTIETAALLAARRHAGQLRKGEAQLAYTHHLAEVAGLVSAFGGDTDAVTAAWLHDIVEDTETSIEEIEDLLGPRIAGMVAEVTDDPSLDKTEQRAAQIAKAPFLSPGAALIKGADQTSNMAGLVSSPPNWSAEKMEAYICKAESVVAGLNAPDGLKLAFARAAQRAREMNPLQESKPSR